MGSIKHIFTNAIADGTNASIVRPSDWNSDHTYILQDAVSLIGNTSGALANISSGTLYLAGGNNVTLSQNANSVSISVPSQSTLSVTGFLALSTNGSTISIGAGPLSVFMSSNTTLTSSGTVDGRSLSFRGVGAISVGHSNGEIVLSAAAGGQSNQTVGWYASSNTTLTSSGTVDARSLTVRAIGSLTAGFSGGELLLSAANALTSQSTQFMALTLAGNTAGTSTFHATNNASLFFNGGNNITLSGNGSTVTISAANQTVQSIGQYALGNTTLTSSSTWDARSVSFAGAGAVTVGYSSNSGLFISAPATSSLSATGIVSISTNGSTISIGAGPMSFYASSNTTLTSSGTVDARSLSIRAIGRVSVGHSAGEILLSVPAYSAGLSNLGNTAGSTGMVDQRIVFVGSNNLSLSGSTDAALHSATVTIYDNPMVSQYDPFYNAPVTNSSLGQSTVYFVPFDVPNPISGSRVNFFLSLTHTFSGAPNNSTAWLAAGYALYTRMSGTGSDRISVLTSYSLSYVSASASSSTRLSVTNYNGLLNTTSHSTSQYGVQNASVSDYLGSSIAGFRVLALPLNLTLTPNRYWMGFSIQSASQGASLIFGHSVLQNQYSNQLAWRVFDQVSAASNASVWDASNGLGTYSAQTAAFPVSIALTNSDIRVAPIATLPYFNFSGIGTSSNIL